MNKIRSFAELYLNERKKKRVKDNSHHSEEVTPMRNEMLSLTKTLMLQLNEINCC